MENKIVLVVDDEPKIADVLRVYLERDGFQVVSSATGKQAIEKAVGLNPALIILDLNLPDTDGLEVCRTIRKESDVPIIVLTGRGDEVDRIVGLEVGADDYVTKPFSAREVLARVKAVLRRHSPASLPNSKLRVGALSIDGDRYEAFCEGKKLDLTTTEFKLLSRMAQRPGRVFTRSQLLDEVQGTDYEGYERTIDAHVKNLRQKMPPASECGCRIDTVRSVGYKLEVEQDAT